MTVATRLRTLAPARLTGSSADRPATADQPVTVTAARVVRPDQRTQFEQWAAEVQQVVAGFPGHLGCTLLHPGPGSDEYHLVYRFSDAEALTFWERSAERHAALERVRGLIEHERYARAVGLQSFFAVPARPGPPWRSWLLTVAVVLLLTSSFQLLAMPLVGEWPWLLRLLLSAVYVVSALRLLMPRLSRWLGPWLQGRGR